MNKELIAVFEYLEREKGIKREIVIQAIEESLQAAAKKSVSGAANVTVSIHPKTADIVVYCEKEIVETVEVAAYEISLVDARLIDVDSAIGQFIDVEVTPKDFGRIAAQKAKQVISQKLRHAERDVIHEEYRHRIGELISGTVKKTVKGADLLVDLGKVEALLPMRHYPKSEHYRVGDRVLAILHSVVETEGGGAQVILSRTAHTFIEKLLAQEVPEIADGTVQIFRVAREPGYRTKVAVGVPGEFSSVDPVGACVGMRGARIKNVVRELNNENVDVIPYSQDVVEFLQNILSPVEIQKIHLSDEAVSLVIKDEDYPIVIGKRGSNAQLTGKLIGRPIEVKKYSDYQQEVMLELQQSDLPEETEASAQTEDPKEEPEGKQEENQQ